ncbi:MAG: dynamin family protein [Verrucomicrobiota bacterium]|nr:dynamin family protein [Verrucomicrobiota bacterium]
MIADNYLQLRSELETALSDLLKLESSLHDNSAMLDTIQGLLTDIREPLLFVVVGEVKAGKSSLLNALFGQEFAKVDVLPATDRVYIFKYDREARSVDVSPSLTERYQPINFLRNFNVVDTPGTNTMVVEHQTITETFVPRADLVLFVFSVVNPWTQSAWELLHFIQKKWLKNVVFVLQQADLREPGEIAIIRRHLQDTAKQKLGFAPPIFAVSARKALLARTTGLDKERLWEESGFGLLEEQINLTVTSAGARMLKLQSTCRSARVMLDEVGEEIRGSFEMIKRDEEKLARLHSILDIRKEQTLRQVNGFLRGVEQACRESAKQGMKLLEKKLSFWRTWKLVFSKGQWQQDFQIEMETKLRDSVQAKVENAVQLLEADLRGLWPQLQDIIEAQFAGDVRNRVMKTVPDFARQRRELLQSIQLTLVERASSKGSDEQLAQMLHETASLLRFPAGVAAAGGIVALIAAMTSAAVADVTGVVAASAMVVGTVVAFGRRKKILDAYRKQLEEKRSELMRAIEEKLLHAIDLFYREIVIAFQPLETFCVAQRRNYEPLLERIEQLKKTFANLTLQVARTE